MFHFDSLLSLNSLLNRKNLLLKFTSTLQHAYGDVYMGASSVRSWVKHFKGAL